MTCAPSSTPVGSERAVLFGTTEAAAMCVLFAATSDPERTLGLTCCRHLADEASRALNIRGQRFPRSGGGI